MSTRRLLLHGVPALGLTTGAHAFEPPASLIVPFPPGGATDIFARLLAERLSPRIVVHNRPGGGTVIGSQAVARARADEGVLGVVVSAHTINAALRSDLPYDTLRDFIAITLLARAHIVIVAGTDFPATTLAEALALSRSRDRGLSVATPGIGTVMHMTLELLARESGARLVHVPYSGAAPAVGDVAAGRVDLMIDPWVSARIGVEAGRLKAIAATGADSVPGAAWIPRVAEVLPGFSTYSVVGLVGPAGMAAPQAAALADATRAVLHDPGMAPRLLAMGLEPVASSPAEFSRFIEADIARWREVAAARDIRL
jgi:tripartite-type tricarboxylate transporter receptor subunit TctC